MGKKRNAPKKSQMLSNQKTPPIPLSSTNGEEKSPAHALEALLQSHEELTSMLRSVGRRMIQDESDEDELLHRMRRMLRRADRIRHAIQIHDEDGGLFKLEEDPRIEDYPIPAEEPVRNVPARKSRGTGHRLTRPHALRVIKLPRP
jgi:U3 small nucleolar RNA-associated protein 14